MRAGSGRCRVYVAYMYIIQRLWGASSRAWGKGRTLARSLAGSQGGIASFSSFTVASRDASNGGEESRTGEAVRPFGCRKKGEFSYIYCGHQDQGPSSDSIDAPTSSPGGVAKAS
ncbi:hypothetical protein TEQG_08783 [Trichophyton equinum CBS 127.97]|uniref:Uncharacterized protein n=1 Tax=Trichophyton equinum (strain ATCC MYA-4606 / CBS 127.97) TaxID=559882 RepID=F2Q218_TRIEC|nr:hypothetical protein TEQG_08783 [Trichophyton equinum CBS 127.97]